MTESTPLDPQDIQNLEILGQRQKAVKDELLNIAYTKLNIEEKEAQVKQIHFENKKIELELAKSLQEKYGEGAIDIENKVFIPNKK